MQLNITGRDFDITPALKAFTEEKFKKLEKLNDNNTQLHIVFHIEHLSHIAEANAHVDGIELHASAHSTDMYAAIDELVDKMIAQLVKHKEKSHPHE